MSFEYKSGTPEFGRLEAGSLSLSLPEFLNENLSQNQNKMKQLILDFFSHLAIKLIDDNIHFYRRTGTWHIVSWILNPEHVIWVQVRGILVGLWEVKRPTALKWFWDPLYFVWQEDSGVLEGTTLGRYCIFEYHGSDHQHICLKQWYSTFLMPWPFKYTVPHVVVIPDHKIIFVITS